MATIEKKIVPLTIKQIRNLQVRDGKVIYGVSNEELTSASVCAMLVSCEDNTLTFEDSTGQIQLQTYNQEFPLNEYKYYTIHISLGVDGTTNTITTYFTYSSPVTDHNNITSHLLLAYSWHLRQLHADKLTAHKAHAYASAYGQSSDNTGGITGSSIMGVSGMGNMYGGVGVQQMQGHNMGGGMNQTPTDKLSDAVRSLTAQHPSGVPLSHLSRQLNMPQNEINKIVDLMKSEGTIYTTTDDDHILLAE